MKKLRTPLAWVTVAVLAGSGLVLSAGAAQAEPGTEAPTVEYVPGSAFVYNENETLVYNQWHYGNGGDRTNDFKRQQPNGIVLDAGVRTQIIKGNENDLAVPEGENIGSAAIESLIAGLDVSASDESSLTYQIGIRVDTDGDGTWEDEGWSTLRAGTNDDSGLWTSSKPFGDVLADTPVELDVLLDALGEDAYPISYGFLSYDPTEEVLISSFTADGTTTKFADAPADHVPGEAVTEYVTDAEIRPDEVTYAGWHDGNPGTIPTTEKRFSTVAGTGENETLGLKVDGKAQILNGFTDADFIRNGFAAGVAGMQITSTEGSAPVWAQIPVFYYVDGVIAPQFATLRAVVPESGNVSEAANWTSSRDLPGGIAKNVATPLADIVAAIGVHDVIGYGAYVDTDQSATLVSISYDGRTTNFAKAADAVKHGVTFVYGNGADDSLVQVEEGEFVAAPTAPVREGYTFDGWYNGDKAWNFETDVVSGDVTLTAKWTKVTPPAPVPEVPFKDVPKSHMFYKPIQWLAENNLAAFGTTNPDYRPAAATTRGAMATFMVRMFESDYRPAADLVLPFKDVKKTDLHYRGIAWMWENGLVAKSDSYNATSPVTRGAMATFLYRYENGKADTVKNAFPYTDVDKNNVHHKTIAWMADQGFAISGKGAEKFNPTRDLTRGAMATFLYRIYQGKI